ncbi:MAG TPA: hypothetical protein LFW20_05820 [Rickettsia endosymbiont of Omalisus fontisbellaquei]|nr:hypothetical protein [Rickettsia endosymbiont of Omalisus fontisbellaquei]
MLKISDIDTSPVDTKLVTITTPSTNTLNINIPHQKTPLVINKKDLELTNNHYVLKLNSDVATSYGLNSMTLDYSDAGLFSGPTISYDDKLGSITFSGLAADSIIINKVDNVPTLGNTDTAETV